MGRQPCSEIVCCCMTGAGSACARAVPVIMTQAVPDLVVDEFVPVVSEVRAVVRRPDEPAVRVDHRPTPAPAVEPATGVQRGAELVGRSRRSQGHDDRRGRSRRDRHERDMVNALPSAVIGERGVHLDREVARVSGDALLDLDRIGHDPARSRCRKGQRHCGEYAVANQPGPARVGREARWRARGSSRRARRWARGGRRQLTRGSSASRREPARGRRRWAGSRSPNGSPCTP